MTDCTYHIENLTVSNDEQRIHLRGHIRIHKDGNLVGMERVRLNSEDNEELIECLNELATRLAEIS